VSKGRVILTRRIRELGKKGNAGPPPTAGKEREKSGKGADAVLWNPVQGRQGGGRDSGSVKRKVKSARGCPPFREELTFDRSRGGKKKEKKKFSRDEKRKTPFIGRRLLSARREKKRRGRRRRTLSLIKKGRVDTDSSARLSGKKKKKEGFRSEKKKQLTNRTGRSQCHRVQEGKKRKTDEEKGKVVPSE